MIKFLLMLVFSLFVLLPVNGNSEVLSGWKYGKIIDEFTDKLSSVYAEVKGDSQLLPSEVTIFCLKPDNSLYIFIDTEGYSVLFKNTEKVKISIDKSDMEIYQATTVRKANSVVIRLHNDDLVKRIIKGNKMIIKVGDSDTMRVSLKGSAKPVLKVVNECKKS